MKSATDKLDTADESIEELKLKLRKKLVSLLHHPVATEDFKKKISKSITKLVD